MFPLLSSYVWCCCLDVVLYTLQRHVLFEIAAKSSSCAMLRLGHASTGAFVTKYTILGSQLFSLLEHKRDDVGT